jgi:hypothetical protein
MKLKLYYNSQKKPFDKYDLHQIFSDLNVLEKLWLPCERTDTAGMTKGDIITAYGQAILPSVYKKYRVRRVFGSRKSSGWLFGKQVPALLVFGGDERLPTDVYPHEQEGREVTISDYIRTTKGEALKRLTTNGLDRLRKEGIYAKNNQPVLEAGEFENYESWLSQLSPEMKTRAARVIREEMIKFWSER